MHYGGVGDCGYGAVEFGISGTKKKKMGSFKEFIIFLVYGISQDMFLTEFTFL